MAAQTTTIIDAKAASSFLVSSDVFSGPFSMSVGDVSVSLNGTSLTLANSNINVFSSNVAAGLVTLPNNVKLIKDPNNVVVRIGPSNVLKAPASRFSPTFSNGAIAFTGTSFSNVSYQPTQVIDGPSVFTRDISAPNITTLSNASAWTSNSAAWSSNSLLPKAGGSVSGNLSVGGMLSFSAPPGDPSPTISTRTVPSGHGAANERTELILFHGNDENNGSGIDTITLRAPGIRLQTYTDSGVSDIYNPAGANDRLVIDPTGNVVVSGTVTATAFAGATITSITNTASYGSNTSAWTSNAVTSTAGNVSGLSNQLVPQANFASNTANWTSNAVTSASGSLLGFSNSIFPKANWTSNASVWASNSASSATSNLFWVMPKTSHASNVSIWTSNSLATTNGNLNTLSNLVVPQSIYASNAASAVSSRSIWNSNALFNKNTGGDVTGDITASGDITGAIVGATSYLLTRGGNSSGGMFTALPNPLDGDNLIPGNTSIGMNGITVVNGLIADVPEAQTNAALWVKGGITASQSVRVGTFALGGFKMLFPFTIFVGTSGSQTKTQTGMLFYEGYVTRTMPTADYHAIISYRQDGYSDVFHGKISDRTTTSLTLHTSRVNGGSWGVDVEAFLILWAFA